jgi:hypothetical protein
MNFCTFGWMDKSFMELSINSLLVEFAEIAAISPPITLSGASRWPLMRDKGRGVKISTDSHPRPYAAVLRTQGHLYGRGLYRTV